MTDDSLRSDLIVISWWSNCLGLACLRRLVDHVGDRAIYIVQVGKSARQKSKFRQHLPSQIIELDYPGSAPGEHSRVIEDIVSRQLSSEAGLWFVDHDVFLNQSGRTWFEAADSFFSRSQLSLCIPRPTSGPAITNPAFWVSPNRWPAGLSFDPIPFRPHPEARQPGLYRANGEMRIPEKDTLVHAVELLGPEGCVGSYPLDEKAAANHPLNPFPQHTHLGGLFLLAGPVLPDSYREWMRRKVSGFSTFFANCPAGWLADEDPVLLQRLFEFREVLNHA